MTCFRFRLSGAGATQLWMSGAALRYVMLYSDSDFDDGEVLLSAAPLKNWNSPNLDVFIVVNIGKRW